MSIAIIAALPREIKALTRSWKQIATQRAGVRLFEQSGHVVACAGIGAGRVSLAVEAALATGTVDRLLSVGLAGACDPHLAAGALVRAACIVDTRTGERFHTGEGDAVIATASSLANPAEKARLRDAYRATAVDMEAATVARLATACGLSFGAVKAISDDANFSLEGLDRFTTADGRFQEGRFALYTALRPGRWRQTMELGRNSASALTALTAELQRELEQ